MNIISESSQIQIPPAPSWLVRLGVLSALPYCTLLFGFGIAAHPFPNGSPVSPFSRIQTTIYLMAFTTQPLVSLRVLWFDTTKQKHVYIYNQTFKKAHAIISHSLPSRSRLLGCSIPGVARENLRPGHHSETGHLDASFGVVSNEKRKQMKPKHSKILQVGRVISRGNV